MAAFIDIGPIKVGGTANSTGIFNGQNIEDNWDSHAPTITVFGGPYGNHTTQYAILVRASVNAVLGQPIFDDDIKANDSPVVMRA